jgi:hypothetical protein
MTAFPVIHSRVERGRRPRRLVCDRVSGARRLRLLASGDGWSLVSLEGEPVFSAAGLRGRWRCLEFAHHNGVVALVS